MTPGNSSGRMIAWHGGKAGEGKTFIIQNLATTLVQQGQRVLVCDLDLQGRLEYALRWELALGPTLADLSGNIQRFDENTIRGYFPKSLSGVEVASLAENSQAAMGVASQQILRALALFHQAYDFVLVDGLFGWDTLVLSVLDASDKIFMVCSPDLAGLKIERQDVLQYQELKFPAAKVGLLLNRSDLPEALGPQVLESTLMGHKVWASIPYASQATEALNHHQDLISLYPHLPFSKRVREFSRNLIQFEQRGKEAASGRWESGGLPAAAKSTTIDRVKIKERIHGLLLENPELRSLAAESSRPQAGQTLLREKVEAVVTSLMAMEAPELTRREEREKLAREVVDEALGLGPLEDLIRDDTVTEIMVNRCGQIYIERAGKLERCDKHFLNDKQLMTVIERIVAPLGRRIDESQPYVDARLTDGSRVNAIIPPLALNGPCLTIRKFSKRRLSMADLIGFGSTNQEIADFLSACVKARKNIIISGGTGSGKTTLLNGIAAFIPENERIITVEDAAELNLPQPHVVRLETRPANIEGKGAITIRDLVRNCLRMRPDRIVVGECRGGEALDMLQAMNTGHDGSLTTAHANTPKDTIARLETMVLMSGMDLPVRAIREQIAGAVHLIVQQSRLQDGSRKITQVTEVIGMEEGAIVLKDIFTYKQTGINARGRVEGEFKATGHIPEFVKELSAQGIEVNVKIFRK